MDFDPAILAMKAGRFVGARSRRQRTTLNQHASVQARKSVAWNVALHGSLLPVRQCRAPGGIREYSRAYRWQPEYNPRALDRCKPSDAVLILRATTVVQSPTPSVSQHGCGRGCQNMCRLVLFLGRPTRLAATKRTGRNRQSCPPSRSLRRVCLQGATFLRRWRQPLHLLARLELV